LVLAARIGKADQIGAGQPAQHLVAERDFVLARREEGGAALQLVRHRGDDLGMPVAEWQ